MCIFAQSLVIEVSQLREKWSSYCLSETESENFFSNFHVVLLVLHIKTGKKLQNSIFLESW